MAKSGGIHRGPYRPSYRMRECPVCSTPDALPANNPIFEHVIEFTRQGWAIQHAYECRPDMLNCPYNRWMQEHATPEELAAAGLTGPGYFRATLDGDEMTLEEVS